MGEPLAAGSAVALLVETEDHWCHVEGHAVPGGKGWVWCGIGEDGKSYELIATGAGKGLETPAPTGGAPAPTNGTPRPADGGAILAGGSPASAEKAYSLPEAGPREFKVGAITIETPWVSEEVGGSENAVAYLIIRNTSEAADRLISVTADIAGTTDFSRVTIDDAGVMNWENLADGLPIPAKGLVKLEPIPYGPRDEIQFHGLNRRLRKGDTFPATFNFEKAGAITVTFEVHYLSGPPSQPSTSSAPAGDTPTPGGGAFPEGSPAPGGTSR
jgi:copper(I)-binding protein